MDTSIQRTSTDVRGSVDQLDYILLDGSGSMVTSWNDTLNSVQAYIDTVKAQLIKSRCILHVFDDTDRDLIQRDCGIDSWASLNQEPIGSHFGYSPLFDAVNLMGRRLRDIDPRRASIVIVTDGDANHDQFTNATQAKAILDWCRAKGWQITFIGANFDNSGQARLLGADPASTIGVHQKHLANAASALAKKRARYGATGAPMHYTDEEQQQFGGFLAGPSK